ncbi:hypothetical protein BCB68_05170 [Leptotrichia sp. oral taxon 498]|uniref:ERF family protein n=1 Tax=Leptotrichia sp. oral taxon 498 TaxID=712368 RepID=UPI000B8C8694|nr:ERF family protein [Leptotrichia sp. oral taxon 498]ASQ48371.1 hypothetical protein BCB68_05170 [Leptotrichia sp. oral taxon 498]
MNIYEKIQQARIELQEMNLKKSGFNKFANFKYYDLKDFLPEVNTLFNKLKLFSKFDLLEEKATLTIINAEKIDELVVFESPKAEITLKGQNALQMIGSTHTYLKRYCYLNALEIIEDDEVNATIDKDKKQHTKKAATDEEKRKNMEDYIAKHTQKYHQLIDNFLEINKAESIKDLTDEEVSNLARGILKREKGEK